MSLEDLAYWTNEAVKYSNAIGTSLSDAVRDAAGDGSGS